MTHEIGVPAGYHSVTPRMIVDDVDAAVAFLRQCFGASGDVVVGRPAEMRIGDSLIMVSQTGDRDAFPALLYVYVDDADATYQRGLAAGALAIEEPTDVPWGDRRAIIGDQFGNTYQIAHRRPQVEERQQAHRTDEPSVFQAE